MNDNNNNNNCVVCYLLPTAVTALLPAFVTLDPQFIVEVTATMEMESLNTI